MKTRVHLVSMPWADPLNAPIQLGCLKAYLDRVFHGAVTVKTYSPFLGIMMQYESGRFHDFYPKMHRYGELPYLLLYAKKFGFPGEKKVKSYTRQVAGIKALQWDMAPPLRASLFSGLEKATCRYIDEHIAPHLIADGLNVVGLSLNYDQTYASVFCVTYLKRRFPSYKFVFLYGGMSITLPQTAAMLKALGVGGLGVIGEGEKKLEAVVARCLEAAEQDFERVEDALAEINGLYKIADGAELHAREPKNFETQFKSIDELPLPDFREYFDELRSYCADEEAFAEAVEMTSLVLEGTRGCFAKCDFCGLNFTWEGFRKKSSSIIAEQAISLVSAFARPRIIFADNVCDTWCEDYARALVERKLVYDTFMELRAHHPEEFWTLAAISGVTMLQIGVESVSPHLLGKMAKGTKVIQNLRTQKYLCELAIHSNSNLITHHPRSNLEDVKETTRVVRETPHFQSFAMYPFYLSPGSPLYNSLSLEEKRGLRLARTVELPAELAWLTKYSVDFCFELPDSLKLDDSVKAAWDEFSAWHKKFSRDEQTLAAKLTVTRLDRGLLLVKDTRFGRFREYRLEGVLAAVFDACHGGLKLEEIAKATGLGREAIEGALARLLEDKLVLRTEDYHLTLALRGRQELIDSFMASNEAVPVRKALAPVPVS